MILKFEVDVVRLIQGFLRIKLLLQLAIVNTPPNLAGHLAIQPWLPKVILAGAVLLALFNA